MEQINELNELLESTSIICEMIKDLSCKDSESTNERKTGSVGGCQLSPDSNWLMLFLDLIKQASPGYRFSEQAIQGFFFLAKAMADFGQLDQILGPITEKFPQLFNSSWEEDGSTLLTYLISRRQNALAKRLSDMLYAKSPSLLVPMKGENPLQCCLECNNLEMFNDLETRIENGQPNLAAS